MFDCLFHSFDSWRQIIPWFGESSFSAYLLMVFLINFCSPSVFIYEILIQYANGETTRRLKKSVFYQDEGGRGRRWVGVQSDCNQFLRNYYSCNSVKILTFSFIWFQFYLFSDKFVVITCASQKVPQVGQNWVKIYHFFYFVVLYWVVFYQFAKIFSAVILLFFIDNC